MYENIIQVSQESQKTLIQIRNTPRNYFSFSIKLELIISIVRIVILGASVIYLWMYPIYVQFLPEYSTIVSWMVRIFFIYTIILDIRKVHWLLRGKEKIEIDKLSNLVSYQAVNFFTGSKKTSTLEQFKVNLVYAENEKNTELLDAEENSPIEKILLYFANDSTEIHVYLNNPQCLYLVKLIKDYL